jgi:4-aminobutyrate aminotransferase-like enzyme
VLTLSPPLVIAQDDLERALDILEEALAVASEPLPAAVA